MVGNSLASDEEKAMSDNERMKEVTVVVNGRPKVVAQRDLSFDEVVDLGFQNTPNGGNTIYTITYRKGNGNKPEGTIVQGESVKVKDGMIFNVTATDKS
jgi:Multiubiquitin